MHAAHLIPELALARVVTPGGPYRAGDEISLAFTTAAFTRLVAHDAGLRSRCVPLERALVPELISVVIIHPAAPYAAGDVLTLSFVDPCVARVHVSARSPSNNAVTNPSEAMTAERQSQAQTVQRPTGAVADERAREGVAADDASRAVRASGDVPRERTSGGIADEGASGGVSAKRASDGAAAEIKSAAAISDRLPAKRLADDCDGAGVLPVESLAQSSASEGSAASEPPQIRAGERMTLPNTSLLEDARAEFADAHGDANTNGRGASSSGSAKADETRPATAGTDARRGPSTRPGTAPSERVTLRLEWTSERLRRFVQVVDKLFTIDRLGWYRHSLAMRLLIPDEIACGDTLADVEAMRHLHALRAAAVESLGKPLLAACMPGFSVSSDWLETLESPREARAIAGLREALVPYAHDDDGAVAAPADGARITSGIITRRELLPEHATSVEAFLPLLIPTAAHDAALGIRLTEYRRLLVELFAQTARAGEPVRLHQMAQPNHSLDDRLWQLVGTAAEAFGGFAHA